jgi:hypothetical protein
MEARDNRNTIYIPKTFKSFLDKVYKKSQIKDIDRAYYALLLLHYLEKPGDYPLEERQAMTISKKLAEKSNTAALGFGLNNYDYFKLTYAAQVNFRSIAQQAVYGYCSLVINFTKSGVKEIRIDKKQKLIIK